MPSQRSAYVRIDNRKIMRTLAAPNGPVAPVIRRAAQRSLEIAKATAPRGEYPGKQVKRSPSGEPPIRQALELRKIPSTTGIVYLLGARSRHLVWYLDGTPEHRIYPRNRGPERTARIPGVGRRRVGAGRSIGSGKLTFWWERAGLFFVTPSREWRKGYVVHPGAPSHGGRTDNFITRAVGRALRESLR